MFQTQHDWDEGDEISATIIEAMAAVSGKEPTELKSLYEVVDPDALDQLMKSLRNDGNVGISPKLVFAYNHYVVEVEADGTVTIEPVANFDQD